MHCSFVSLLIGPCCLDPICRIQRNIWLKTRQQGRHQRVMYFPPFWNKVNSADNHEEIQLSNHAFIGRVREDLRHPYVTHLVKPDLVSYFSLSGDF